MVLAFQARYLQAYPMDYALATEVANRQPDQRKTSAAVSDESISLLQHLLAVLILYQTFFLLFAETRISVVS